MKNTHTLTAFESGQDYMEVSGDFDSIIRLSAHLLEYVDSIFNVKVTNDDTGQYINFECHYDVYSFFDNPDLL